ETLKEVAEKLAAGGLRSPKDLEGSDPAEVAEAVGGNAGLRAFARRVHGRAAAAAAAAAASAEHAMGAGGSEARASKDAMPQPERLDPSLVELFGSEASAAEIAKAMSANADDVNVPDLLKAAKFDGLPYHMQADFQVWTALAAGTKAAVRAGKTPFTYVDLTANAVLPAWLPADAVGGKSIGLAEDMWESRATSSISQLGAALRAATASPRCFRSIAQWSAAYLRYVPVAVAVGQLTWATALTHHATIVRLAEESRVTDGDSVLAVLYDQLQRQHWAKRAAQRDPELDIPKEAAAVNEQTVLAARTRLDLISHHLKPTDAGVVRARGPAEGASDYQSQVAAAESALAKGASAAQAITKRAEQAAKAMASQQEELNKRQIALQQQQQQAQGRQNDSHAGSSRDAKRKAWMDNARQWKQYGKNVALHSDAAGIAGTSLAAAVDEQRWPGTARSHGEHFPLPPDVLEPFVPNGGGQPKGLSKREQIAWQLRQDHPLQLEGVSLDADLGRAIGYELAHSASEIDADRSKALAFWSSRAEQLRDAQVAWASDADPRIRQLVLGIHGPLVRELCEAMGFKGVGLVDALQQGFPYVGSLPKTHEAVVDVVPKALGRLDIEALRNQRWIMNQHILGRVRATGWDGDIWAQTSEDAQRGAMSEPVPVDQLDLGAATLSRRLPVREQRSRGWKTRVVDNKTESGVNEACRAQQKVAHDGLDVLVLMLLQFARHAVAPRMWKRDISRAFRRLAIAAQNLDLAWVVFLYKGTAWAAQHLGMPFGTTSAVYAWHRVGAMLLAVIRRICLAPAARFVDDFFGCSKDGVCWTGGGCLTIVSMNTGLPCAREKDADDVLAMVVLGAKVAMDMLRATVSVQISDDKAVKCKAILWQILCDRRCSQETAMKMAGRLSFATYAPLRGEGASCWLLQAAAWWLEYLAEVPAIVHSVPDATRRHVHLWTDAAGASRWLAAVLRVDRRWLFTRTQLGESIWRQLLPRGNHHIGLQELLAVPLAYETFSDLLRGALVTVSIDNQGDANLVVGKVWLDVARYQIGLHAVRVESHANVADDPTRDEWSLLRELGAVFRAPQMPSWAANIWHISSF
ncbi:unnamed protein product, partial [Prorocentrum cordatum]